MRHATLALLLLATGCATTTDGDRPAAGGPAAGAESVPITNTDACASRLHEISGALLFHQLVRGGLPDSLDELATPPGVEALPEPVCPVSSRRYVYRPRGIYLQEREQYVVLHDPAPSHARMRWAITFEPAEAGSAPVTDVILLPESFFVLDLPDRD